MRTSVRPWSVAIVVAPIVLLLSACGLPGVPVMPGGGEQPFDEGVVEDIVEGSGDGIDMETGELPADFPVDAVPLVPGEIGPTVSIADGQAWSVTVYAADQATAETATELLEAAGFSNESQLFWDSEEYTVIVVDGQPMGDGRYAVAYQVNAR
jgi:hypothetical protein